jgi:hypothetical protein
MPIKSDRVKVCLAFFTQLRFVLETTLCNNPAPKFVILAEQY